MLNGKADFKLRDSDSCYISSRRRVRSCDEEEEEKARESDLNISRPSSLAINIMKCS